MNWLGVIIATIGVRMSSHFVFTVNWIASTVTAAIVAAVFGSVAYAYAPSSGGIYFYEVVIAMLLSFAVAIPTGLYMVRWEKRKKDTVRKKYARVKGNY